MRGIVAAIFAGLAAACENEDHIPVELLRFITAYRQDLNMHVDVTPFAKFLAHPEATFETMVDTWVGPDYSTFYYVYDDAQEGKCDMHAESYGRGILLTFHIFRWLNHQFSNLSFEFLRSTSTRFWCSPQAGSRRDRMRVGAPGSFAYRWYFFKSIIY